VTIAECGAGESEGYEGIKGSGEEAIGGSEEEEKNGQPNPMTYMDPVRCPYCVEEGQFKLMDRYQELFICKRCGHQVAPGDPTFTCTCGKCGVLNRPNP
jgi:hypothetical protein